jgi:hypothetical protein
MFDPMPKVTGLSPCKKFCFVEGTTTGIPVAEIVEVRHPSAEKYTEFATKLKVHYLRLAKKEGIGKWEFCLRTIDRWNRLINKPILEEVKMLQKQIKVFQYGEPWPDMIRAVNEWAEEILAEKK